MKKIYLIIIYNLCTIGIYSQFCSTCDNSLYRTNPNPSFTIPNSQTFDKFKTNRFNWWNYGLPNVYGIGPINKSGTTLTNQFITSPFYASATSHLAPLVDNRPAEAFPQYGWELIKQDLGYFYDDGDLSHSPPRPEGAYLFNSTNGGLTPIYNATAVVYYALYNKYTGKLRIIFLRNDAMASFASIAVTIGFVDKGAHASALFNAYNSVHQPLNEISKIAHATAIALCPTVSSNWTYVDFQMAYDPCTCHYNSELLVDFCPKISGKINLETRTIGHQIGYKGTNTTMDTLNGKINPFSPSYISSFVDKELEPTGLMQEYTNLNKLSQDIIDANEPSDANKILSGLGKMIGFAASIITQDYAGAASKAFDFFSSAPEPYSAPMLISSQSVSKGELHIIRGSVDAKLVLANPGSCNSLNAVQYTGLNVNTSNAPAYPMYNKTMGLFALKNSPIIEFNQTICPQPRMACSPSQYTFKLNRNSINILMNPIINTSNTKIYASIEFFARMNFVKGAPGVFQYNNDTLVNLIFQDSLKGNKIGKFSTKIVPLECLPELVSSIGILPFSTQQTVMNDGVDKVFTANIVFYNYYEFITDEYGTANHSFQLIKFPCKFSESGSTLSPSINLTKLPINLKINQSFLNNLNATYSNNNVPIIEIYSFGKVTIENGTDFSILTKPLIIKAEEGFKINQNVVLKPTVSLLTRKIPDVCQNLNLIQTSTIDCQNNNEYKANLSSDNKKEEDYKFNTSSTKVETSMIINVLPNPANNFTKLYISNIYEPDININITNVNGKMLYSQRIFNLDLASSIVEVATSEWSSGIYYVKIHNSTQSITTKFIIEH